MEVPDLLANAVTRFPDRVCVRQGTRSLTFAEADARADRAAAAFIQLGLRTGDRVAVLAENELEYLELQAAANRARVTLLPLNYRCTVDELSYLVGDSRPRLLVHGPGYAAAAEALGVQHTWHLGTDGTGGSYRGALAAAAVEPRSHRLLDATQPAAIMYTSGTTGRPKGAILSCGAVWARINLIVNEADIWAGDVLVQALPMFHIAAHVSYGFAYRGAVNLLLKGFHAPSVIDLMRREQVTHALFVPTMINLLTREPTLAEAALTELRMVLYGASAIPPEVLRRAIAALPRAGFLQFFGMTETFGASMLRPADHDPDRFPERLASAGTDSLSFATRIVDAEDHDVDPGEVGQILSRGPALMDGYWGNPEATAAALAGGWMHTGDLGYRSREGYLFITDRVDDMIISGGENVYPREVEDVLYEHPAVLEAAVVGLPDEQWGQTVHAVVVGTAVTTAELTAHCRTSIAGYKIPRTFEFTESLPRNATGKVLRRKLRASVREPTE